MLLCSRWLPVVPLLTLTMASLSSLHAADWSRFRGPNGAAVSDTGGIPTSWDDTTNMRWKTPLPGPGSSSPIVVGDRIFVTCYSGYGVDRNEPGQREALRRHLVCVSRRDGSILWDQATDAAQPEDDYSGFIREHGYAASTPASDGERVYVFFGKSGVWAYDLEGKSLWNTVVGDGSGMNGWGSGASPVVEGDLVIINAAAESKAIVALDKRSGKEVWRSEARNIYGSWSTPVIVEAPGGKRELVISAPYEIWAFDPVNGDFRWFAEGVRDNTICGSVVARDGIVYAVGGRGGSAVAVRAGGQDDVSQSHTIWKKSASSYVPSPVLSGDRILSVNERGVVNCLSVTDGETLFNKRLPDAGGVYASPIIVGDKAYVVTRRKGTFVMSLAGDGEVLAHNTLDDDTDFNASPAVADGLLLLRSNRCLYAIGGE